MGTGGFEIEVLPKENEISLGLEWKKKNLKDLARPRRIGVGRNFR